MSSAPSSLNLPQPEPSFDSTARAQHFAIVGGGMLGLTLALRLCQAKQKVTLFESADRVGGLADAWTLADVQWDRHYHVISTVDSLLRGVLEELDLEKEIEWVETRTGFFSDGQLISMSNAVEFLKFPPLNLIEKFRLGATIFCASKMKNWRKLEQVPVTDWLRRWSGRGTFRKIWEPLLRAKLGDNYTKASAAFIWATIQRMYKARRTGMKKEMFGYVPGGYQRILDAFAERLIELGVEIKLNSRVKKVTGAGHLTPIATVVESDQSHAFDQVILTTPTPIVSRVCPDLSEKEHQLFQSIEYQGIVCTSVLLRQSLSPYYVTNITDNWVPLTGVIEMTRIVDPQHFGGHHLVYLPRYVPADDPWLSKTDEEIESIFRETLLKMYPKLSATDFVAMRTSKVKHVMAVPTLNYSQKLPPMSTSLDRVYAINSAHILGGILNVNETMQIAEDAFRDILRPLFR